MSEWQPIESAPKDGREVLVCFQSRNGPDWIIFTARAYSEQHGGTKRDGYAKPTYWMPLPAPPFLPTKVAS